MQKKKYIIYIYLFIYISIFSKHTFFFNIMFYYLQCIIKFQQEKHVFRHIYHTHDVIFGFVNSLFNAVRFFGKGGETVVARLCCLKSACLKNFYQKGCWWRDCVKMKNCMNEKNEQKRREEFKGVQSSEPDF